MKLFNRTRYVIIATDIMERTGYVNCDWFGWQTIKPVSKGKQTDADQLAWATLFRFEYLPHFFCWLFNRYSTRNLLLLTFSIKQVTKPRYRYVIHYTTLFTWCTGYVNLFSTEQRNYNLNAPYTHTQALAWGTKFKYKWLVYPYCWYLNTLINMHTVEKITLPND
ncbi:MAG: hypothetical protein V4538_01680 [Bacteroidota bacterium]